MVLDFTIAKALGVDFEGLTNNITFMAVIFHYAHIF